MKISKLVLGLLASIMAITFGFLAAGCDLATDTADTTKDGGNNAVGVAEKMSKGSLGDEMEDE